LACGAWTLELRHDLADSRSDDFAMQFTTKQFACLAILALCLTTMGCRQNPGLEGLKRSKRAMQSAVDMLKSINDPASAQAAIPKIAPVYQELLDATALLVEYHKQHGDVRGPKRTIDALGKELPRLQQELGEQSQRVDELKGLPAEFWIPMREYSYRVMVAGAQAIQLSNTPIDGQFVEIIVQMGELYEELGAKQIVEVELVNVTLENRAAALQKLREAAGPGVRMIDVDDPLREGVVGVVMGPVADYDALVAKVKFGTIALQEKSRGDLTIDVANLGRAPAATQSSSSVTSVQPFVPADETEEPPASAPSEQQVFQERVAEARAEAIKMGVDPDDFDRLPGIRGPIGVEIEDIDESAPDYHAKLAEMLNDGGMSQQRDAMRALLRISPSSVQDKKVRADIARGFRDLTFDSPHPDDDAVKGLILWGGKHSVPLLIRLMEKNGRLGVDDSIYDGLAQYPTPEGAEAVAARLGNFFDGDMAASCLKRMGPVAEEAVIEVAPADNLDINFFALAFLKDFGTKKSYPLLQKARKSPNRQIREAAVETLREIRLREQAKEKAGEEKAAA
jgi:hypothetical protein